MSDAQLGPAFSDHVSRLLEARGASLFEARRFLRLPPAAQVAAVAFLEDRSIAVRDLLTKLEECVS